MICFLSISTDFGEDNLVIKYLNSIYYEEDIVLNIDIKCHFWLFWMILYDI